ncbi:MAG: hypothetical protein ACOH1J_06995 [Microbacteriaceae bacterium]
MSIAIPRTLIVTLAAIFSGYHLILAWYSIALAASPWPAVIAGVMYAMMTVVTLVVCRGLRLPSWVAGLNVLVVLVMCVGVSSQLNPERESGNGYATWYVAAAGTLMTITSARRRHAYAWLGTAILVVHTLLWAGAEGVVTVGVIGSVAWVALSHIISAGIEGAKRDARRFALAEREATDWQAAQEAHIFERQSRLAQTSSMALSMLRLISENGGELSDEERDECLRLETAIRDEIRGRGLLNDAVREEVSRARLRGATVILLDEGGVEELSTADRDDLHSRIVEAIRGARADRIIVRSNPDDETIIATVVGVHAGSDDIGVALGAPEVDDYSVDVFVEIPRRQS